MVVGAAETGAKVVGECDTGARLAVGANVTGAAVTGALVTGAYVVGAPETGAREAVGAMVVGANVSGANVTVGAVVVGANETGASDAVGAIVVGAMEVDEAKDVAGIGDDVGAHVKDPPVDVHSGVSRRSRARYRRVPSLPGTYPTISERQYFHSSASPSAVTDVAHHGRLAPLARYARPPSSVSGPVPYAPAVPTTVQLS